MGVAVIAMTDRRVRLVRPLLVSRVSAGFPSPADDWVEGRLDLNRHLIKHPSATFYVRVAGDSMRDEQINDGDILIVDRACEAEHGDVVIARVFAEFVVRKLCVEGGRLRLLPGNDAYQPIEITEDMDFEVWGKVLWSFRAH
jgi:DNA polymerase V